MATSRGSFDLIGQSEVSLLSGGVNAQQAVTTDLSTKPNGAGAIFMDGNLIAGGTSGAVGSTAVTVNGSPLSSDLNYTVNASGRGFTINGA